MSLRAKQTSYCLGRLVPFSSLLAFWESCMPLSSSHDQTNAINDTVQSRGGSALAERMIAVAFALAVSVAMIGWL